MCCATCGIRLNKELLLTPLVVSRTDKEVCFIEPSINSVRVSLRIKQADEIEEILCHKFTRFLMQRAEQFIVMRRKPVEVRPTASLSVAVLKHFYNETAGAFFVVIFMLIAFVLFE
jgi:hypothetical protein